VRSANPHVLPLAGGLLGLALFAQPGLSQDASACWIQPGQGTKADAAARPSPLDSASVRIDGAEMKVCYGAPSARGRQIMGALVPYDLPWRAGADEATTLRLSFPAQVAGVRLEPGAYSLYVVPRAEGWRVVLNATVERWGVPIATAVTETDIGAGTAGVESTEQPVERLRYRFDAVDGANVDLLLEWERTRVRIPIRRLDL